MRERQSSAGAGTAGRILVICPTARDRTHLVRPDIRSVYDLKFLCTDEATHEPGFDGSAFLREAIRHVGG